MSYRRPPAFFPCNSPSPHSASLEAPRGARTARSASASHHQHDVVLLADHPSLFSVHPGGVEAGAKIPPLAWLVKPQPLVSCQQKPRLHQPISSNLHQRFSRLPRPLFPACDGPLQQPGEPTTRRYWQRQAVREALLVALVTTWLTSAVQVAPQLFTQSPVQSLQDMKALLLPGGAGQPLLQDCP